MDIKGDVSDFKALGKALKEIAGRSFPAINGRALNRAAFATMRKAQDAIRKKFILRSKFSERSIKFEKVKGFNIKTQESKVGSTFRGLALQETGGIKKTRAGGPVAIPEAGARTSRSIRKRVRRAMYLNQLKLVRGKGRRFKSKGAKLVAGMFVAKKRKIALKLRDNIYRVKSIRAQGRGSGRRIKAKLVRLYHVGKKQVTIPKKPWLLPSVKQVSKNLGRIYISEAQKKLKKDLRFLKGL